MSRFGRAEARGFAAVMGIIGLTMIMAISIAAPFMPTARAAAVSVSISNFAFVPQTINVNVGDTITWTNNDGVTHTVTSNTGAWTSITITAGSTGSITFNTAGTFGYHCSIHTSMTGTVIVGSVVPEFSDGMFVVLGLAVMMLGLIVARRRHT